VIQDFGLAMGQASSHNGTSERTVHGAGVGGNGQRIASAGAIRVAADVVRESPLGRHSRLDTLRELKGSAFSFARIAKQLAFHGVETVRRGEEPVPTGIANHDAGSLR
jgi:hypothetical protein